MTRAKNVQWCLCIALACHAAASLAQTGEPIKIGGSIDLSGPVASLGQDVLMGAQYAVDVINKHGGVLGRPVAFEQQDNGTNSQRAVSQDAALAHDGAVFLVSPISSGSTIAASKVVSGKLKVPMCVPTSAAEEITMKEFQPYIFSFAPTGYMLMKAVTMRLSKQPYRRYALMVPDYAGGRTSALRFKQFLLQMNPQAQIVVEEYPKLGATDYTASINKIIAAKPDYVWAQVFGSDLLTFAKQATALGFFKEINNRFMTVYDTSTLKMLGDSAPVGTEGYQYAPFNYISRQPDGKAFVAGFKAKTGQYPSDWAINAYECVTTWAQAANAAKSTEADAVMHAIEANQFDVPGGKIRFARIDHEATVSPYLGKIAQSKEFGQAVIDIDEIPTPSVIRPSDAEVEKSRKE